MLIECLKVVHSPQCQNAAKTLPKSQNVAASISKVATQIYCDFYINVN